MVGVGGGESLGLDAEGKPTPAPLPSHRNQSLPFPPLSLSRIGTLQPILLTMSAMPWTSCIGRWVRASVTWYGGGAGGRGEEGWSQPGAWALPPSRGSSLIPKSAAFYLEGAPEISGIKKGRHCVLTSPSRTFLGVSRWPGLAWHVKHRVCLE